MFFRRSFSMVGKAFVSGKHRSGISRLNFWLVGACVLLATAPGVRATEFLDFVKDPLSTAPPVLASGATLPGDSEPIICPPRVDLARPLALGDAVDMALCNNPQLMASWAAIKIQSGALGETRATYLPTLNGSASKLRNETKYPDASEFNSSDSGHTMYLGMSWRVFDFGGRSANNAAANNLLSAALASHDSALQKGLMATIGAYFDAMTAQAVLSAKTTAASLASETLAAVKRREAKGVVAMNDVLQSDAALAKARLEKHRAEGDFAKAVAVLVYNTGLSTGTALLMPPENGEINRETINELAQWIAEAQERHPEIVAARLQWEAAKAKVESVRSEGLPTVDLTGNFYQNGYPNQALQARKTNVSTLGVTLNIPLFEGFSRHYKIYGAEAMAEQKEAQSKDVEHQVLTELVKAHAEARSSLNNLQSSEDLLRATKAAVDSSERRYAKGVADILELLSVQSALTDAQQQRIRSLNEWRAARLRLFAAAGTLGRIMVTASSGSAYTQSSGRLP